MITWLHGGVKWKIKIKTEKFTHILPVWPCQGVVRIGHVPVSAWTQLPVALWVSFPHAGAAGDDSSSPLCWDVPPGTVYGPLCISAAWRARSASTELSSESCVSCSSDSDLFIWTADCYPWFMWIQIKCQDFTSVLYRMLDLSNLKAAPMRWRIWGGFSPGNRG